MYWLSRCSTAFITSLIFALPAFADDIEVKRVSENRVDVDYGNLRVLLDCKLRNAVIARFTAKFDDMIILDGRANSGDIGFETSVPSACNPVKKSTYFANTTVNYRHQSLAPPSLLPPNQTTTSYRVTNMVPVTPQTASVVRDVNIRIACQSQSEGAITVFTGPVYTNSRDQDYFFTTHGQLTPNGIFIVAVSQTGSLMSLLVPNHVEATPSALRNWLRPVSALDAVAEAKIPISKELKTRFPSLWSNGCNLVP